MPYQLLSKNSKATQVCGALCLTKIVQNSNEDLICDLLESIIDKILATFKQTSFKAQASLLETLISVIFHVESMIEVHSNRCIDTVVSLCKDEDPVTKKVAIDAVYSIAAITKEQILPRRM